jgi:hypothetical protein
MSWFKSAKIAISTGSISAGPNNRNVAGALVVESEIADPEIADPEIADPEIARPKIAKFEIATLEIARPADVAPRESPKAVFDSVAKSGEKLPREKIGFTVHASKNGETSETQRTSPTITVAKARILFKSGWRVYIADAAGREYGPSEFDEILKFDRH